MSDDAFSVPPETSRRARVLAYLRDSIDYRNTAAANMRAKAQLLAGIMCEVVQESHAEAALKAQIATCLAEQQQQEAISCLLEDAVSFIERGAP